MVNTVYILFEDKKEVITLNETGSIIWNLINGDSTVSNITEKVLDLFDGDNIKIKSSVIIFMEELLSLGAITISLKKFEGVMKNA